MLENIKIIVSIFLDKLGILDYLLKKLNKTGSNYIRVVNYHDVHFQNKDLFYKQLVYFKKNFECVNLKEFMEFKNGNYKMTDKPGILITFDDGYENNFSVAREILNKLNIKGLFFVSSNKIDQTGYMSLDNLKVLMKEGHFIGSHTRSHHRMNQDDENKILVYEIVDSKKILEELLDSQINTFCWCGGELDTYTYNAAKMIKENYEFSFMTNSEIVRTNTDNYKIQRTNIEDRWSISMVKFQVSGIMDYLYKSKRSKIEKVIEG